MNTLCGTYDGAGMRAGRSQRRNGLEILRSLLARLTASASDGAPGRFPDEDEVRLTWLALGRGFDCM